MGDLCCPSPMPVTAKVPACLPTPGTGSWDKVLGCLLVPECHHLPACLRHLCPPRQAVNMEQTCCACPSQFQDPTRLLEHLDEMDLLHSLPPVSYPSGHAVWWIPGRDPSEHCCLCWLPQLTPSLAADSPTTCPCLPCLPSPNLALLLPGFCVPRPVGLCLP